MNQRRGLLEKQKWRSSRHLKYGYGEDVARSAYKTNEEALQLVQEEKRSVDNAIKGRQMNWSYTLWKFTLEDSAQRKY